MRKSYLTFATTVMVLSAPVWAQVQVQAQVVQAPQAVVVQQPPQVIYQQAPQVMVAPPAGVVVPPGVVYVAPAYAAPAVGFVWTYDARYGWGWHHPRHGWYRR
jgi:hypothetical protein